MPNLLMNGYVIVQLYEKVGSYEPTFLNYSHHKWWWDSAKISLSHLYPTVPAVGFGCFATTQIRWPCLFYLRTNLGLIFTIIQLLSFFSLIHLTHFSGWVFSTHLYKMLGNSFPNINHNSISRPNISNHSWFFRICR